MKSLPGSWAYEVRERVRALRVYTSTSAVAAAGEAGKTTLLRVEGHTSTNVYLDSIASYCTAMGRPLEAVLLPWTAGAPPDGDTHADPSEAVRRRLRALVETHGLRPLATKAKLHHSTLARLSSGEYRRIDLIRLERIARATNTTPAQLVLGTD